MAAESDDGDVAQPGPGDPGWAWRVNRAVITLARAHRARAAEVLQALDLYPGQEVLLLVLADAGPCSPGRLATALSVEPPTVTKMVSRLEASGLVQRDPAPHDGRSTLVSLTQTARQRLTGVDKAWHTLAAETLEGVADSDRLRLIELLEQATSGLPRTACEPG